MALTGNRRSLAVSLSGFCSTRVGISLPSRWSSRNCVFVLVIFSESPGRLQLPASPSPSTSTSALTAPRQRRPRSDSRESNKEAQSGTLIVPIDRGEAGLRHDDDADRADGDRAVDPQPAMRRLAHVCVTAGRLLPLT